MPVSQTKGPAVNGIVDYSARRERSVTTADRITEAAELRSVLLDSSARLAQLLSGLKQHRRADDAMQPAMQWLKQIKLGI